MVHGALMAGVDEHVVVRVRKRRGKGTTREDAGCVQVDSGCLLDLVGDSGEFWGAHAIEDLLSAFAPGNRGRRPHRPPTPRGQLPPRFGAAQCDAGPRCRRPPRPGPRIGYRLVADC